MNWNHEFEARAVATPEEAITCVKSGDTILSGIIEPYFLFKALAGRTDLNNVYVLDFAPVKGACFELIKPELKGRFHVTIAVASPLTMEAVNNSLIDFIPADFTNALTLFKSHLIPDVMFIHVTPPDPDGYCNLGLGADYTRPSITFMKERGKPVIAEVNDKLPSPIGDCRVHVTEIDQFVVVEEPLKTDQKWSEPPPTGWVIDKLAEHLDALIDNGSTIEIGIGRIPGALARKMTHKRDLGIHTEVFADAVFELVKAGCVTGRYKTVMPNVSVATILQGSAPVMEWATRNPAFCLRSADFVLDPTVIAANHKIVAINGAVQLDLCGQICAESVGFYQLSTAGGQSAMMHGASLSPEGKAIIVIESTASKGQKSRIVNGLDFGAAVTTIRSDIDYVLTEYGVAKLAGKGLRERARALISIAHPKFRDELTTQAHARGLKL